MSLASTFKTSPDLERKGVKVELPAHDNGDVPFVILARAGRNNPDYQKVVERIMRPHRRAQQLNALPQAKQDELTRVIFAEGGILGWGCMLKSDVTGNDGKNGKPLDTGYADYSIENAVSLFENLPDLYSALIEMSTSRETFIDAAREDEAKNSVKSLPTSSSRDTQNQAD